MTTPAKTSLFLLAIFGMAGTIFAQPSGGEGSSGYGNSGSYDTTPATSSFVGAGASNLGAVAGNYVLKPLDSIVITFFQEPTLETQARISADGSISMPMVGELIIGNMTVSDAQKLIADAYRGDYLINPHVTIIVTAYQQRQIFVHGHVHKPGPVFIPPERELTLTEAINNAGGVTRMARKGNIKIRRLTEEGKTEIIEVDLDEVLEDPDQPDIILRDGDQIIVDERII